MFDAGRGKLVARGPQGCSLGGGRGVRDRQHADALRLLPRGGDGGAGRGEGEEEGEGGGGGRGGRGEGQLRLLSVGESPRGDLES